MHVISSPRNGKAEVMMKKLISTSWNRHSLDEDQLARALLQYRNTLMVYHQPRNFLDGQFSTDYLPIAGHY
jgi:hypothetical protein